MELLWYLAVPYQLVFLRNESRILNQKKDTRNWHSHFTNVKCVNHVLIKVIIQRLRTVLNCGLYSIILLFLKITENASIGSSIGSVSVKG